MCCYSRVPGLDDGEARGKVDPMHQSRKGGESVRECGHSELPTSAKKSRVRVAPRAPAPEGMARRRWRRAVLSCFLRLFRSAVVCELQRGPSVLLCRAVLCSRGKERVGFHRGFDRVPVFRAWLRRWLSWLSFCHVAVSLHSRLRATVTVALWRSPSLRVSTLHCYRTHCAVYSSTVAPRSRHSIFWSPPQPASTEPHYQTRWDFNRWWCLPHLNFSEIWLP